MNAPDDGTQRRRVLRTLIERGVNGITQGDFLLPGVIDGGDPITRLAARIEELRDQGCAIDKGGKRGKFDIYRLADSSTVPVLPERLFEPDDPEATAGQG